MGNIAALVGSGGSLPGAKVVSSDPNADQVILETMSGSQLVRYMATYNPLTGSYSVAPTTAGSVAPTSAPTASAPTGFSPAQSVAIGEMGESARQFDISQASDQWRVAAQLAEQARIADANRTSNDWQFGVDRSEDSRLADASRASGDWQFGTGLAESARTTDNALNATNWRFGEGLQENARQFNVGEMGVNDRARLAAATQGFQSVNQLAPQLGQLALDNAAFTAKMTQNPADFVARAFFQRGGESPLPTVSQADLINQLTNNISQYNNVLSGFAMNPLTNPQFLSPSQYGGYTNQVGLQSSPYGSYGAPPPPNYSTATPISAPSYAAPSISGAPTGSAYGSGAYAMPAPTSFGGTTGGTSTGTTSGTTAKLPTTTAPKPAGTTTSGGTTPSYLSPSGDPWGSAAQQRYGSGLLDGSIVEYYPPESEYPAIAANADSLFQPDSSGQDFRFEVNDQGTLVAIPMAFGGATRAPLMMVGDHPSGMPTGNEEIISNPTGAPISVIPNPNNEMGIPTTPPSFNQMPALPEQASAQAGLSRFGGVGAAWTKPRGFRLPAQADPRAGSNMPRFGEGTEDAAQRGYSREEWAANNPYADEIWQPGLEHIVERLIKMGVLTEEERAKALEAAGTDEIFEDDPRWSPATMGNQMGYMSSQPNPEVEGNAAPRGPSGLPLSPIEKARSQVMPRFALGTDFQMLDPADANRYMAGGTVASTSEPMAITDKTSEPTSFYQSPSLEMLQPGQEMRTTSYGGAPASQLPASTAVLPGTTSIGMNFQAPQLPTQPQVTQQQLIDYARAYSPPAVSNVINGTMPETLRFGFPLPSPQLLNSLTPAERQALNTRMAVEFNTSLDDVEHAMKLRFTNARQRPRGRYAVGR